MDKQFFESLPMPIKAFLIEYDYLYQIDAFEDGMSLFFKREISDKFTAYASISKDVFVATLKDKVENLAVYSYVFFLDNAELEIALAKFESICVQVSK